MLALDVAWRFQSPEKVIAPFVDIGIVIPRYWVITNGRRLEKTSSGIKGGVGLCFNIGKTSAVDLSVSQMLNHVSDQVYYAPGLSSAPCPLGEDCWIYTVPDDAFNEATIELTLRSGL
jgi:hypothetical protein